MEIHPGEVYNHKCSNINSVFEDNTIIVIAIAGNKVGKALWLVVRST